MEALRGLHIHGDPLPEIAHAAGRSSGEYANGLLALLADLRATVEAAVRPERRIYHVGAHGRLDEHLDLPPGYELVPRERRT